ncbi:hypothetical protein FB451DRAFT_1522292 [Mycena latifolia]|nr:hypothetical protein FB451DRAFT_1522292 [Mycena latifolia]
MPSLDILDSGALWAVLGLIAGLYALYPRTRISIFSSPRGPEVPSRWQSILRFGSLAGEGSRISFTSIWRGCRSQSCVHWKRQALLEKHAATYSDRRNLPMVKDLMGWDYSIGEERALRVNHTARRIWGRCPPFRRPIHFRGIQGYTYAHCGYFPRAVPRRQVPNFEHVPKWFPGARFKRQAEEWRKLAHAMMEMPFAETKRQMPARKQEYGTSRASFTSNKETAGSMFIAGAGTTTASTLETFILGMLANPEAQKKGQAEIDSVTGQKYIPGFGDREP